MLQLVDAQFAMRMEQLAAAREAARQAYREASAECGARIRGLSAREAAFCDWIFEYERGLSGSPEGGMLGYAEDLGIRKERAKDLQRQVKRLLEVKA